MLLSELYELFLQYPTITTDSRNCPNNSIFFALKGEHFDGNEYVELALQNGAKYAIADKKNLPKDDRIIITNNVLQTLQNLARYHRKVLNTKIIAITGTNGKTTTKELIASVLLKKYNIFYTQGNFNNHIGVPLTLLQLRKEHEFAVVEMGANHIGEIEELCNIAHPDYGIITNIGKAHLEGFGSLDAIVKTKTELYNYLRLKGGIIFGNIDDPLLNIFYTNLSIISYGSTTDAFIQGKIIRENSSLLSITWEKDGEKNIVDTQLTGAYNFENLLAAICIGSYFNIPSNKINDAISSYIPRNNRSQIIKTEKNKVLLDAYNANPTSMSVALNDFFQKGENPKMVILGEMKELGDYSQEEHSIILTKLLSQQKVYNKALLIGDSFKQKNLFSPQILHFCTTEELIIYLKNSEVKGYYILVKGSRVNQLEKIIPFL